MSTSDLTLIVLSICEVVILMCVLLLDHKKNK